MHISFWRIQTCIESLVREGWGEHLRWWQIYEGKTTSDVHKIFYHIFLEATNLQGERVWNAFTHDPDCTWVNLNREGGSHKKWMWSHQRPHLDGVLNPYAQLSGRSFLEPIDRRSVGERNQYMNGEVHRGKITLNHFHSSCLCIFYVLQTLVWWTTMRKKRTERERERQREVVRGWGRRSEKNKRTERDWERECCLSGIWTVRLGQRDAEGFWGTSEWLMRTRVLVGLPGWIIGLIHPSNPKGPGHPSKHQLVYSSKLSRRFFISPSFTHLLNGHHCVLRNRGRLYTLHFCTFVLSQYLSLSHYFLVCTSAVSLSKHMCSPLCAV